MCAGSYLPCACLVALGFSGCNSALSMTLLVLAVGFNGAVMAGYNSSHLDLAPNFAGTLMGRGQGLWGQLVGKRRLIRY